MADFIKNSYVESSLHTKVIFQRNRDVIDFELNEFQDILRVFLFRSMFAGAQQSSGSDDLNPGSNDDGWKIVGTGASNQVTVTAGTIFCDGVPINKAANATLTGFTTYGGVGSRTDVVYMVVTETEIADPAQMPALGETSLRQKLGVTLAISTTGLAGVPANTSAEIWEGGTHYFPIASITRATGVATIADASITDLRKILAPTIQSQITRQADGAVEALVASIIETPDGGLLPISPSISIDVDPYGDSAGSNRSTFFTFGRDDVPYTPFRITMPASPPTGLLGMVELGHASWAFGSTTSLKFIDANVITGAMQNYVAFSSSTSTNGDKGLRILESGLVDLTRAGVDYSILQAINGRFTATIGNGTTSFGDYNGANAIAAALVDAALLTATSVRLQVKAGTYLVTTQIVPGACELYLEGIDASAVVLENRVAGALPMIAVEEGYILHIENITLREYAVLGNNAGILVEGGLKARNCEFDNQSVELRNSSILDGETTSRTLPVVEMTRCGMDASAAAAPAACVVFSGNDGLTHMGFVFDGCTIKGGVAKPAIRIRPHTTTGDQTKLSNILFDNCIIITSTSPYTSGAYAATNCGVLEVDPNSTFTDPDTSALDPGMWITDLTFRNCEVSGTAVPSGDNTGMLLYCVPDRTGGYGVYMENITIEGGRWLMGGSVHSGVVPFYVGGYDLNLATALDSPVVNFTMRDVEFGFASTGSLQYIQGERALVGGMLTLPATDGEWAAFTINARNVTIKNCTGSLFYTAGKSADLFVRNAVTLDVDGLTCTRWQANGGAAGQLPRYRFAFTLTDATAGPRRIRNLNMWNGLGTNGAYINATAEEGILSVDPGGELAIEACSITGFFDSGGSTHRSHGIFQRIATSESQASGLSVMGCTFDTLDGTAIRSPQVGDGAAFMVEKIVIAGNKINACNYGIIISGGSGVAYPDGAFIRAKIYGNSVLNNVQATAIRIAPAHWDDNGAGVNMSVVDVNNNSVDKDIIIGDPDAQIEGAPLGTCHGNSCIKQTGAYADIHVQLTSGATISATGGGMFITGLHTGYKISAGGTPVDGSAVIHTYATATVMLANNAKLLTP